MQRNKVVQFKGRLVLLIVLQSLLVMLAIPSAGFPASVALNWDPSSDADLAGYKVYYQANSSALPFAGTGAAEGSAPINAANATTATIDGLDPGSSYYFAVTAYNTSGAESVYSNIIEIPESVPPVVAITAPSNNASVNGAVTISATASDNVGVASVQFYLNGALQATVQAAPYLFTWDTSSLSSGAYIISAKAFDAAGNEGQSGNVTVNVAGDTAPPTVSLTAPGSGVSLSGSVSVTASASDNVGVTRIEVCDNGVLAFASNQSPASYSWNTFLATNGSHTLTAKAYDAAGNVGNSSITVTVNNQAADTSAPMVMTFAIPSTAGSLIVPVSSFTASDNVAVAAYLITESAAAPSASAAGWSPGAPGSFSFAGTGTRTAYAWVKDAAGNVSASLSATTTISVTDTTAPIITSISPAGGAKIAGNVTVSASATDNVAVTTMQLYIDNVLQLTTTKNSFAWTWNATKYSKGTAHVILVKAYDAANNMQSQSVTVFK